MEILVLMPPNAGKWTKTYDKVKVMGKSCVTEISELMCTTGGKIKIMKHGQQSRQQNQAKKANAGTARVQPDYGL